MHEWDDHHGALTKPLRYGAPETYRLAADWVRDCDQVEDWGCGGGGLSEFIEPERYIGIDGSASPYAAFLDDLTRREVGHKAEGVVLRHVLEHSYEWAKILDNALYSFTKRLAIVLFTPLVGTTHLLHTEPEFGDVPVIAFENGDLALPILDAGARYHYETAWYPDAHFGTETMIYVWRP